MKIPDLVKVVDLSTLPNVSKAKEIISKWVVIKSLTYNKLIIKPLVRSFNETPYLVVNDDLTINEVGLWLLVSGNRSKVLLHGSDELVVDGRCYVSSNDLILCIRSNDISILNTVTGGEEVLLDSYEGVEVKSLYSSSVAIVSRGGRKYAVIPMLKEKIIEVQDFHYVDSRTTAMLLIKYKRKYFLIIYHKYLGISKLYELGRCDDVKEVLVGDGLGIVRCGSDSHLVSYDELLRIPQLTLEPIASVGSDYILYEPNYGVLVRFDGREFKQLLLLERPNVLGRISTGDLIVVSNGYPYILTEDVCKVITNQKVMYGSVGGDYIALRTFKNLEVYNRLTHIASYKPLECRLINNSLICIQHNKLLIYDLNNIYDAKVYLDERVNNSKYPNLNIVPWNVESKLVVRGPVIIEELRTTSKCRELNVKPFKLGKELTFKVMYDATLTQFNKEFKVKVNSVDLRDLVINNVKYSPKGSVNSSGDNLLIDLTLNVLNPTPEEIQLFIKYSSGRGSGYDDKVDVYILKPGINELRVRNTLRVLSNILQILIEFKWFNRNEHLAKLTLDLNKYLVREPVKEVKFVIKELSNCSSYLIVIPSYEDGLEVPIDVVVACSDNEVFRGVNEVLLNSCLLPAVIELNYSYDGFMWRRYKVIKDLNYVTMDLRPNATYAVDIRLSSKCVNGFLVKEALLDVRVEHLVRELSVEPYIDNTPKIKVSYELTTEGMVLVVLGSRVSYCRGMKGSLNVDFNDFTKDLVIVVLGNGVNEVYRVDSAKLISRFLELGVNIGTLLKPRLLGGSYSEVREDIVWYA